MGLGGGRCGSEGEGEGRQRKYSGSLDIFGSVHPSLLYINIGNTYLHHNDCPIIIFSYLSQDDRNVSLIICYLSCILDTSRSYLLGFEVTFCIFQI